LLVSEFYRAIPNWSFSITGDPHSCGRTIGSIVPVDTSGAIPAGIIFKPEPKQYAY
jgi:hypothetical protein